MNKNKKRKACWALSAALLGSGTSMAMQMLTIPMLAAQKIEVRDQGVVQLGTGDVSIEIQPSGNATLFGRQFTLYRLFDAIPDRKGESIAYQWNGQSEQALRQVVAEALKKDPASLHPYEAVDYVDSLRQQEMGEVEHEQSPLRFFLETLRTALEETGDSLETITIQSTRADGSVLLSGLTPGYYLLDDVSTFQGDHNAASLCMAISADSTAQIRLKADYPTVTKQIFEDDQQIGWNDIADAEIGQDIPFRFQSQVPNLNGYETYYFAFHDKMDPCLDFDAGSLRIVISDEKQELVLTPGQYTIQYGQNDATFSVVIEDLKALVDSAFDLQSEAGTRPYGQKILIEYNAALNEQAASQTGRPGFENSVRLEFSNNPDSNGKTETGFTPWDTVVCFTYRLDGQKVNDAGTRLPDATFGLFRDEACQDEVFLKREGDSYTVVHLDSIQEGMVSDPLISDANGEFVITGLDQGTYYLKEIAAPDGYRPLLEPIRLELTPVFCQDRHQYVSGQSATDAVLQQFTGTASVPWFVNGQAGEDHLDLDSDVDEGSVALQVVNRKGNVLPSAGSSLTVIGLSACAGLLGAGIYWLFKQKGSASV